MAKPRFVVKTLAWSAANVHTLTPLPQFTCRPIVLTYPMHHCNSLMSPQCSLMKKTQFWPGTSQIYLHGLNVQGIAHKLCHCVTCLTAYPQGHLIRTVKALNCKANRDLVDSTNASADAHNSRPRGNCALDMSREDKFAKFTVERRLAPVG
jgi:hypothetical protein